MPEKAYGGKLADPAFRQNRARAAALKSHSLDSLVRRIVDRAPELSTEQRQQLAAVLNGGAA